MKNLDSIVHDFVRRDFQHQFGRPVAPAPADPEWAKLRDTGSRLWLDTGDLDEAGKLWNSAFDSLTTNNTLLNKEIQKGTYDEVIAEAGQLLRELDPQTRVLEIAFILNARHALRLVARFDAFVSVELHTDLAHDVARMIAYGQRYFAICPERFIVKVPLTPAGYIGARQLVLAGIPVNFTLGFSARQNYLAARFTKPRYVNVFMGRLNSFVADNHLGPGDNVGEKATLATQRELLALRRAGGTDSHLIGASIRSGSQIGALAGVDVFTMPTKAAAQYRAQPLPAVVSRLNDDPAIPLAPGITLGDFNADTLWEITPAFRACVDQLNPEGLTPVGLQQHFQHHGFADFLPAWSEADIATHTADGKIPVYAKWKHRLASGAIGLDALMNLAALQAFAVDQAALDDRIRQFV